MYSWKADFRLHQLTPLICFNCSQKEGAPCPYDQTTLRATEVKPKLDRFLLWSLEPERFSEEWRDGSLEMTGKQERETLWQIARRRAKAWTLPSVNPNADPALNYKMRITANNPADAPVKYVGAFFGSKGMGCIVKNVTLTILCFEPELMQKIRELLPMFFAVHNFGLRQDKGFGSFEVVNESGKAEKTRENLVKEYLRMINTGAVPQAQLYILKSQAKGLNGKGAKPYEYVLNMAADFNQRIKSGINNGTEYAGSILLKKYIPSKHAHWINEKRAMKEQLATRKDQLDISSLTYKGDQSDAEKGKSFLNQFSAREPKKPYYIYVRGVLGTASQYSFRNIQLKERQDEPFTVLFSCTSNQLGRFPSPLLFLPVAPEPGTYPSCLVLVSTRLLKRIQKASPKFIIKAGQIKASQVKAGKKNNRAFREALRVIKTIPQRTLAFPSEQEFDLLDFFHYLEENLDLTSDSLYSKPLDPYNLNIVDDGKEETTNGC